MHPESIEQKTGVVLEKIAREDFVRPFYLAGGTALAIHFGHRISVDLDFFTPDPFSPASIREKLSHLGAFKVTSESADGTLNGILDGVSVSFFIYPYKNVYPLVPFRGVFLADERDIAAMKVEAISSRGSRKDFVDLYFLLKKYPLGEIILFFERRYSGTEYNKLHILKSLSYFTDAESELMPTMILPISWDEVKRAVVRETKKMLDSSA